MCLAALVCAIAPGLAQGQGAAISTLLDPSVRGAGMGRASNAVFWGGDPDYWANPALLGYYDGIRHDWAKTQFVPTLARGVFFETNRLTFAAFGIGISTAGKWSGLGGLRLDYGVSRVTGPGGVNLGTFHSWEEIESWGIGVSAARFLEHALPLLGLRLPPLSPYGDVAIGRAAKDVDVVLTDRDLPGLPPGMGRGRTSSKDRGILFRLTPYNSMGYAGWLPALDSIVRGRLDLSYGGSELNYNDATIWFGPSEPALVAKLSRHGLAVRVALDPPARLQRKLDSSRLGWLSEFLSPALSVARAWDDEIISVKSGPFGSRIVDPKIRKSGWEISLLNVFTYRHGRIDDPGGSIHGGSSGWSLGLAFGDMAGFRYDRASVPQATVEETGEKFPNVHRRALTVFADPIRLLTKLYRSKAGA